MYILRFTQGSGLHAWSSRYLTIPYWMNGSVAAVTTIDGSLDRTRDLSSLVGQMNANHGKTTQEGLRSH